MEGQKGETKNFREPEDGSDKKNKEAVNPTLHSGSRGLNTKEFSTTPLVEILENIQCLYRKPIYQDLDTALLRLNYPMTRIQPV